jgi:hypothetical protein
MLATLFPPLAQPMGSGATIEYAVSSINMRQIIVWVTPMRGNERVNTFRTERGNCRFALLAQVRKATHCLVFRPLHPTPGRTEKSLSPKFTPRKSKILRTITVIRSSSNPKQLNIYAWI